MNQNGTILIADDEPIGRETLAGLLTTEGYRLAFACSGAQTLNRAIELIPDLILLDVMMPEMDGFEVCRRLRANPLLAEVPIILVSALDESDSRLRGIEAGADDFISKPFDRIELRARVRSIMRLNRYRRLLEERVKFERLFTLLPNGIMVIDCKGNINLANPAMLRMLRDEDGERVIGRRLLDFIAPEMAAAFSACLSDIAVGAPQSTQFETSIVRLDGVVFPAEVDVGKFLCDNHPAAQIIVRDITEKKSLEAQVLRAQRIESIGTLASGIAHDLNNVLTPTIMAIQILKKGLIDPRSQKILKTLEETTHRGAELVKQVLLFGRGIEGDRTIIPARDLIMEIERIVKEIFSKSIDIRASLPDDLWSIVGDSTQLHQVLMNLCVNARDAMQNKGTLSISARNFLIDDSYTRMNLEARVGPYIIISISDTGVGIPPKLLDKIFEPFFTTKELGQGTGLGLSTAIGIVKSHGGFINVYSEVGKGTEFRIYLPATGTSNKHNSEESSELLSGRGELILIADDEEAIRDVTQRSLEAYGYKVLTAEDGIEAISLYTQHREEISAVLTDMMMPLMDGPATIRALHRINPEVKIIAASGLSPNDKNVPFPNIRANAFLPKPYTAKALLKTLRRVLSANVN
jgi:two-component system, cell cycle sensor histidine kinase and response regulator CckA